MIGRIFALALTALGGGVASQGPEFTQQYAQRLGGAVDELSRVVAEFDRNAADEGLSREAALMQMSGTGFLDRRREGMEATIARHARLSLQLADLRAAGNGAARAAAVLRRPDPALAGRVWESYQPAVPLNATGLVFTAVGGLAGWLFAAFLLRLGRVVRRRGPARRAP